MNKVVRITVAFILSIGILFLAKNQIASAGSWPWQNTAAVQGQSAPAELDTNNQPGTVKPPPVVVPPITKPGTYSLGGVCIIYVEQISDNVMLRAQLLPFVTLRTTRPQDTTRYLAGVCDLTYQLSGKPITDLSTTDGTVKICFAAIPNTTSKIYVYDGQTWTALDTAPLDNNNTLECAIASKTGKYVLAAYKQ